MRFRSPETRQKARVAIMATMAERSRKVREYDRLVVMVGALLNHCDKDGGECHMCSVIVCPLKDPLHFHHDGCPSCSVAEEEKARLALRRGCSGE